MYYHNILVNHKLLVNPLLLLVQINNAYKLLFLKMKAKNRGKTTTITKEQEKLMSKKISSRQSILQSIKSVGFFNYAIRLFYLFGTRLARDEGFIRIWKQLDTFWLISLNTDQKCVQKQ